MDQTAITYPYVTVNELTGEMIKTILEDVADNLFNPDPYYQQGGDMVRVGGLKYAIDPAARMGSRITAMMLAGKPLDPAKRYKVAGWAPVSEEARSRGRRARVGRDGALSPRAKDDCAACPQSAEGRGRRGESRHRLSDASAHHFASGSPSSARCSGLGAALNAKARSSNASTTLSTIACANPACCTAPKSDFAVKPVLCAKKSLSRALDLDAPSVQHVARRDRTRRRRVEHVLDVHPVARRRAA